MITGRQWMGEQDRLTCVERSPCERDVIGVPGSRQKRMFNARSG